jgi:uncharacterized protein (TIGR03083 family)
MDDITLLRRAVDDAARLIDGVRPDQLGSPTPCPDFTVEQLIAHLVEGAAGFSGGDAAPTWREAGARMVETVSAPGYLDSTVTLPWGEYPGTVVLQQALGETAIHAADLAHATGQSLGDDAVYERDFGVVTEDWRVPQVLEAAQPCADDAPLVERVLAFAGRKI